MMRIPDLPKKFDLDGKILSTGSVASVELSPSTDSDVVSAILANSPFPIRSNGRIELGHVLLDGNVKFKADKKLMGSAAVSFSFSGAAGAGAGIYDDPADALRALNLAETPQLDLALPDDESTHFFLIRSGYGVSGSIDVSHPIGAFGTVQFGDAAKGDFLYALLHRFDRREGARDVVERTVGSWRLPRHVETATDLRPGTWVLAEVDGSLAVRLAAELGYDFNYVHEVRTPGVDGVGLTGDLGFKIETGLKVALGLSVSGRYLILVGRESDKNEEIRLRMFKLSKKEFTFGLNLSASVQDMDSPAPDSVDALIQAVFGVHGLQIIKDLQAIERWTDPSQDLSDLAPGLPSETGLELLRATTGFDPATAFSDARNALLGVLKQLDSLPGSVPSKLWSLLGSMNEQANKVFRDGVEALAVEDAEQRREAVVKLISGTAFDDEPIGQWLTAVAASGLLALTDELGRVGEAARATLALLEGNILKALREFLEDRLNLDQLRKVTNETSFRKLDPFLVNRLSMFLDEELGFHNLGKVREAINHALRLRQEIHSKAREAIASKYEFDFAYNYQKTTIKNALVDVVFDFSRQSARDLFRDVVIESNLDRLLVVKTDGVRLNQAVLTHQIDRKGVVQVTLPKFNFTKESVNKSLDKVTAACNGRRVLVYELDARDVVRVKNRLRSQLTAALSLTVALQGRVRVHSRDSTTVSCQFVHAKENMRLADLKHLTQPFIFEYMPELFQRPGSLETWYLDLDRAVEDAVGNGRNEFGDVLTAMEVMVPGSALAAWLLPRSEPQREVLSKEISKSLQAALKTLIPFSYFQDPDRLQQDAAAAALLVWASIPPCSSARLDGDGLILNETEKDDVYWDFPDPDLREKMVMNEKSTGRLRSALTAARDRLLACDKEEQRKRAQFFTADQAGKFQRMGLTEDPGEQLLGSLLFVEADLVKGAAAVLKDVAAFLEASPNQPLEAIERLAAFGADITDTFHRKLSSIYGGDALRSLGGAVLLEAARVLDGSLSALRPRAMLSLTVLREQRRFQLPDFLGGKHPEEAEIALKQRLVSTA